MTAKVRLLLFWVGADDVGGGYIRRSVSTLDPSVRLIQVLFDSDPAKAPRGINNWGAATEAVGPGGSALFGFRKSVNTDSADDAQAEIRSQASKGQHGFEGVITVADRGGAFSRVVPVLSKIDFTLHQLDQGQEMFSRRLIGGGPIKELKRSDLRCERVRGFLDATDELIEHALVGKSARTSRCYVHNARNYTVTLESRSTVPARNIRVKRKNGPPLERSYRNLLKARFSVLNRQSGKRSSFELLLGTVGGLRGVPVQIVHQPNWWFRAVLNLEPGPERSGGYQSELRTSIESSLDPAKHSEPFGCKGRAADYGLREGVTIRNLPLFHPIWLQVHSRSGSILLHDVAG